MSDAAARALAADGLPASREQAEERYVDWLWNQVEGRRNTADRKARERADDRAQLRAMLDDVQAIRHYEQRGPLATKAFVDWLRAGPNGLSTETKASLVLDATGQVLVPVEIAVDILNVVRQGVFRSLADRRPTNRTKHRATLLTAASVGWGRLETGTTATDPNTLPESPAQEVEVFDLLALGIIGNDELNDSAEAARAAVVDSISSAILDAEDAAFATGAAADRPKGIVNATNIARIPAGQKVAVSTSNTPTWAQLSSIPFLLPDRYRDNGAWIVHPTSASKIGAMTEAAGHFTPGGPDAHLMGWPFRMLSALPDPATAGTGDASILFGDIRSAYRLADRDRGQISVQRLVQRYAHEDKTGFIVKTRVGGDLIRPSAVCVYTQ